MDAVPQPEHAPLPALHNREVGNSTALHWQIPYKQRSLCVSDFTKHHPGHLGTRQTKLLSVWLLPDSSSAHKFLSGGKLLFELEKSLLVITKLQSFPAQRFSVPFPVAVPGGGAGRAHCLKTQAVVPQAGQDGRGSLKLPEMLE